MGKIIENVNGFYSVGHTYKRRPTFFQFISTQMKVQFTELVDFLFVIWPLFLPKRQIMVCLIRSLEIAINKNKQIYLNHRDIAPQKVF